MIKNPVCEDRPRGPWPTLSWLLQKLCGRADEGWSVECLVDRGLVFSHSPKTLDTDPECGGDV